MGELYSSWNADSSDYFDGDERMKLTREQKEACETIASQAVVIFQKAIEESGSVETAQDILCQYFIAVLYGRNKPRWML